MKEALLSLAFVACPVGMGLMMWFMARGQRKQRRSTAPPVTTSIEQLREEHRRLGAELERLDGAKPQRVASRT